MNAVTLSVPATASGVSEAILAFDRFGRSQAVADGTAWRVRVAIDEILSNIIRHGRQPATVAIEMTFSFDADVVAVEIRDSAAAFNPLLAPAPDTSSPLAERQPGGLGILLARTLMDEARYERRDNRNYFLMKCGRHADR